MKSSWNSIVKFTATQGYLYIVAGILRFIKAQYLQIYVCYEWRVLERVRIASIGNGSAEYPSQVENIYQQVLSIYTFT